MDPIYPCPELFSCFTSIPVKKNFASPQVDTLALGRGRDRVAEGGEAEVPWYLFIFISTFSQPSIARKMCVKMGCPEGEKGERCDLRSRSGWLTPSVSLPFPSLPLPLWRLQAAHVCGNG